MLCLKVIVCLDVIKPHFMFPSACYISFYTWIIHYAVNALNFVTFILATFINRFCSNDIDIKYMGACGPVDRALDSRSEGLRFDSQCWPWVEVSGKHCIPHCLGPPSHNGYLVHRSKVGSIVAGCCGPTARGGKVWRTCVVTWISGL